MKQKLLNLLLFIPFIALSQIPSYYNDVNLSLTGSTLKDELAVKIISSHTNFLVYTPGVWDALKQTDLDPADNTKVLLIYGYDDNDGVAKTDRTRSVDMNGGNIGEWNREHVYAKSLGTPNLGTTGPGSDAHHLRPADGQWNSTRNNRKFTDGSGNAAIVGTFWYPGDEWKGDVARMMMYMYLRYGNQCLPINVGNGNPISADPNMIDLFLQWNVEDPVSAFEMQRNPILETIQGNRNPFIDNPAFATQIWGGPQAEDKFGSTLPDTEAPTAPSNLISSNVTSNSVILNWTASTDNVFVSGYDVYLDGVFINSTSNLSFNVTGLTADTTYSYTVYAKDSAGNVSSASNTLVVTTGSDSGATTSELFISEYVEGSSYNKAIEIANFTGASIDLSAYSLKRNTNGGTTWGAAFALTGTVVNQDVFVVSHSSAATEVINAADVTTGASAMTFNGNDPVGLFKNDVLIDVVGTFNGGTANFAANTTLRRNASVLDPSTAYIVSQWDSYSVDAFNGLGSHTISGTGGGDTVSPSVVTNVNISNITETTLDISWSASTDNVAVTEYDVYIDGGFNLSTTNTFTQITGLTVSTSYSFNVYAKDAAGNVSDINTTVIESTLDLTSPSIPLNVVASNITDTSIDLTWDVSIDNVGVSGYDVYESGVYLATVTGANYQAAGLTPDTMYAFTITAFDASGNTSVASNVVEVTTNVSQTGGSVVLHEGFFESGWDGWSDGGSDCARYSGSRSFEGSYAIRLRDNSGIKSAMTSEVFDLSSFNSVDFEFYFYSYSMENGEDFFVEYFDGNTWVDVANYISGSAFNNNGFYVATIRLDGTSYNLSNNAQFRIRCDASNNSDHIYIDQITITGNNTGLLARQRIASTKINSVDLVSIKDTSFEGTDLGMFSVYPNPVKGDDLNIEIDLDFVDYSIYNLLGQRVMFGVLNTNSIKVNTLKAGIYIIKFNDGENVLTKKFIKE